MRALASSGSIQEMKMWFLRPKGFEADYFIWNRPKPKPARLAPIELPRTIGGEPRK